MATASTNSDTLVVKPREACRLLACGRTRLYQLIAAREIDSFADGGSRKISTESIRKYVERQLAAAVLS
jgi:excisionase family DNA binding protein